MFSLFGRLFKTLNNTVDKDIDETIYKNEAFKLNKWRFFEGQIIQWSQRYLFYVSMLFVFFVLLTANLLLWKSELKTLLSPFVTDWSQLKGWQQTFLAGQLTIVAVVYPLVIGLIAVLIQNTAGSKTILPIYQKYSGFMFSGLSGLVLPLFILLGFFSRPWLGDSNYIAVCISTATWLSTNILLTSWFFVKTFLILDSTKRDHLVIRYSINELCIKDIKLRLKAIFVEFSCHKNLIYSSKKEILKVESHNFSDDGFDTLTTNIKNRKSLYNMKFWLLNLAVRLQLLMLYAARKKENILVFKPYRLSKKSNEFQICKSNFKLNVIVKFLIKQSLTYKVIGNQSDENFKTITDGLLGSVIDSINNENTTAFKVAIKNLIEWHTEISATLAFVNDHGEKDNWILLPNGGFFGRSYLSELNTEYYQLSRLASEKITTNTLYFQQMLILHKSINSLGHDLTAKETTGLIEGNYLQWHILVEWYSAHLNKDDIRLTNKYEDILYTFIGAWEGWLMSIEYKYKREGDMKNAYPAFVCHIGFTAQAIVSAVRFENYEAANWAIDVLNNWEHKFAEGSYHHQEYEWNIEILTTSNLLNVDNNSHSWKSILNGSDYKHIPAFELAFKNLALDLRLITACYILLNPKKSQAEELRLQILALLSGQSKEGIDSASSNQVTRPGEILGAYLRHKDYLSFNQDRPYNSHLSSVIEQFERMDMGRMVSGRTYSSCGGIDSPGSLNSSYVEMVLSLSTSVWQLSTRWYDIILSEMFSQAAREAIIYDLKQWINIVEITDGSILFDNSQIDKLKSNFKESVSQVIDRIQGFNDNLLKNAVIDNNKLKKLAVCASSPFIEIDNPKYPFSLFSDIGSTDPSSNTIESYIKVTPFGKDRIAEGIEDRYEGHDESWLAGSIQKRANRTIYQAIMKKVPDEIKICESVGVALRQISRTALDFESPVVLVSHRNFEITLRKYLHDINKSIQYRIERRDGFGSKYICHVDNCAIYRLPYKNGKQCLMTSKNLFEQLLFIPIDGECKQYVQPSFNENESRVEGDLSLTFSMEVKLSDELLIKLDLTFDDEAD